MAQISRIYRIIQRQPFIILILLSPVFFLQPQVSLHTLTNDFEKKSVDIVRKSSSLLQIASWNLRVPFPQDLSLNLSWSARQSSVIAGISQYQPDLLALQEDCYFMSQDLLNTPISGRGQYKLSDNYNRYGLFNRNGQSHPSNMWPNNAFSSIVGNDGEHNSVWYNKHRFEPLQNVTFWLSHTPNVPSSFDEETGRIVNCLLLRDTHNCNNTSNNEECFHIFYCSTHFPAGNVTRQLSSVTVLSSMFAQYQKDFTDQYYGNNTKLIMMIGGDFNSPPESESYHAMIRAGFVDVRTLSNENIAVDQYSHTTNDWYGGQDSTIDHVWIYLGTDRLHYDSEESNNVLSVEHVPIPCCIGMDGNSSDRTASDHLMIIVKYGV